MSILNLLRKCFVFLFFFCSIIMSGYTMAMDSNESDSDSEGKKPQVIQSCTSDTFQSDVISKTSDNEKSGINTSDTYKDESVRDSNEDGEPDNIFLEEELVFFTPGKKMLFGAIGMGILGFVIYEYVQQQKQQQKNSCSKSGK